MIVASFYAPRLPTPVNYLECLSVLQASCDRLGLRHVVISDRKLPGLDCAMYDLHDDLMMACIQGQRWFLEDTPGPVLLTGADCIVTRDPRPLLDGFDLVGTVYPFSDCCLNTGLVMVADGPSAAPIWGIAEAKLLELDSIAWGDDQIALKCALAPVTPYPAEGERHGLKVKFVSCVEHNWAPEAHDDDAGMPLIAHFRGERRKGWMGFWYRRFLENRPV